MQADKTKWYIKILILLLAVAFLPLIIILTVFGLIYDVIYNLNRRKAYQTSPYYIDFGLKYRHCLYDSPQCRFYNSVKERGLDLRYLASPDGFDTFEYKKTQYVFPPFDSMTYDEASKRWQICEDGDYRDFMEAYGSAAEKFAEKVPNTHVKILLERSLISDLHIDPETIPDEVELIWEYENAFSTDEIGILYDLPETNSELYEIMSAVPDLRGELKQNSSGAVCWSPYSGFEFVLSVDDAMFDVLTQSHDGTKISITHWHPTVFEMMDSVLKINKRDSVTVLKKGILSSALLYVGPEKDCPYSTNERHIFKKLYYLK